MSAMSDVETNSEDCTGLPTENQLHAEFEAACAAYAVAKAAKVSASIALSNALARMQAAEAAYRGEGWGGECR